MIEKIEKEKFNKKGLYFTSKSCGESPVGRTGCPENQQVICIYLCIV